MKILFLSWAYAPHTGGVEKHVQKVAERLVQKGFDVTILTTQTSAVDTQNEVLNKVQIIRIPFNTERSKYQTWKWIVQHRRLFSKFDVVHIHDVFWWIIPVIPLVRRKVFITFHGWEGTFPVKRTAMVQRRLAAKLVQGVVQVGGYIQKWYGTVSDVVTYGAVDGVRHSSEITTRYTACFVGRLSKDNDVEKVVALFTLYKQIHPKARFVFLGDGELRGVCETIGEVVGFTHQVIKYVMESSFVCASSYLSIMEAQSCGKLVCAFYSNPLKKDYLIGYPRSQAMIIEDDPKTALEKVGLALSDEAKNRKVLHMAKEWTDHQTWEKLTKQYIQLWKSKGIYIV